MVPPGDKSISHRALFAALLSGGRGKLENFCLARDCRSTITALAPMGLNCQVQEGIVTVAGPKPGSWSQGSYWVDAGNSGTTARLLMGTAGFLASQGSIVITGDQSLSQRPMERVAKYLRPMGMEFSYLKNPGCLPLKVEGARELRGLSQEIEVPSAQVKSAVLLAGLAAQGTTEIMQRSLTRDHTEVMLEAMGADIVSCGHLIRLRGGGKLKFPEIWEIPGDFSGAAWWLVMAAVAGRVQLYGVGVNPSRLGLVRILEAMGTKLTFSRRRFSHGEAVADILAQAGELQGVEVPPELVPTCIDELPALAVAAAFARGRTVVRGAGELRVKESDRIAEIARMLSAFGAQYEILPDGFSIRGRGRLRAASFSSQDHRIVMAAVIMAALVPGVSCIGETNWLDISYPGFLADLNRISPAGSHI